LIQLLSIQSGPLSKRIRADAEHPFESVHLLSVLVAGVYRRAKERLLLPAVLLSVVMVLGIEAHLR
jgi:hypothetical protein